MAYLHSACLLLSLALAVTFALNVDVAAAKPAEGMALRVSLPLTKGVYPLRRRFTSRGCSSFGHSCFGGHGKRSDEEFAPAAASADYMQDLSLNEPQQQLQMPGEGGENLHYMPSGDIVPLLRQWLQLQSYRRLAENSNRK